MNNNQSVIEHNDIIGITEHIVSLLELYINSQQYENLEKAFTFLEHFENSNYNFMNVNSINHDKENFIYTFKINNAYYQFYQCDPNNLLISTRALMNIVKNSIEFIKSVKNINSNYSFNYLQELISSNFNRIINKYINLHKFLKIIERKPLCLNDVILFFNNIKHVFNDKFEILETFLCVDNVMYMYHFDLENNFTKSCIAKLPIPQLRINENTNYHVTNNSTILSHSTIFTPEYSSFFNNSEHIPDNLPDISDNTCEHIINESSNDTYAHVGTTKHSLTVDNYNKTVLPTHEKHIIKSHDYYKTLEGFKKVTFGLFDSDSIIVINHTNFILYFGNEYIRFSEYELSTDIFYEKLASLTSTLYCTINIDFKQYQVYKDMLCNNIFDQVKLSLFQKIYYEYLSIIDILENDLENILVTVTTNATILKITHTFNMSLIFNTYTRFSKLFNDIDEHVLISVHGNKFDIYYIDYLNTISLFATNYNMTVTPFIKNDQIYKIILSINDNTVILEEFTDIYTASTAETLFKTNLLNLVLLRTNIELNLKNIEDLYKKQYR